MPDTADENVSNDETVEETTTEETEETQEVTEETPEEDELPEWAQKEIADLRAEAAKRRTQNKELQQKLSEASTAEDVESVKQQYLAQIAELELQVTKAQVARELKVPDFLIDRLRGSSEDELREDAKALVASLGTATPKTPRNPSGGLNPDEEADRFDAAAYAEYLRKQRGF